MFQKIENFLANRANRRAATERRIVIMSSVPGMVEFVAERAQLIAARGISLSSAVLNTAAGRNSAMDTLEAMRAHVRILEKSIMRAQRALSEVHGLD